ncbi:hypothetical protein [Peptostreptococcus porci]|uniref:hypothetical protein n=1 Tax=Peptostreptococcus porci TaxID=2652282 RepID=UPI002A8025A7|nr:hypothetical protein [Peptostreptococcus porci]
MNSETSRTFFKVIEYQIFYDLKIIAWLKSIIKISMETPKILWDKPFSCPYNTANDKEYEYKKS